MYNCCHFDALLDAGKFNIMTTTDVVSRPLHWSSIHAVLLQVLGLMKWKSWFYQLRCAVKKMSIVLMRLSVSF